MPNHHSTHNWILERKNEVLFTFTDSVFYCVIVLRFQLRKHIAFCIWLRFQLCNCVAFGCVFNCIIVWYLDAFLYKGQSPSEGVK